MHSFYLLLSILALTTAMPVTPPGLIPNEFILQLSGPCSNACRGALQSALASSSATSGCSLGPPGTTIGSLTFEDIKCPPSRDVPVSSVSAVISPLSGRFEIPPIIALLNDAVASAFEAQPTSLWGVDEADGGVVLQNGAPQRDGLRTCSMTSNNGANVMVWILDTGCTPTANGLCTGYYGGRDKCADRDGHGSHVGGTATDSTFGVAPAATRNCVKVLGNNGSGKYSNIIRGIGFVVDNRGRGKGDIVNMSLGGGRYEPLNDAVIAARAEGVYFSLAAGNERSNACQKSPASAAQGVEGVYSVQAHDEQLRAASFTNFATASADCTDLSGPGVAILSFGGTFSGTSMAAPHVAGAMAVLLSDDRAVGLDALTANSVVISISGALDKRTLGLACA